ncbi:MAG: helix-hairpin-helix domain-containing protein, partial [Candidatus Jordarchaeales archaeon]
ASKSKDNHHEGFLLEKRGSELKDFISIGSLHAATTLKGVEREGNFKGYLFLSYIEEGFMDTVDKLRVLGAGAEFDKCSSSPTLNKVKKATGLRPLLGPWVYPAALPDGGCMNLLKILYGNICIHDCGYCAFSRSTRAKRVKFSPEEFAKLFMELYREGYVEGLFLSSSVCGDSDSTMNEMIEAVRILREKYGFSGYVHLKVLPGASYSVVREAATLADRLSVNLEAPSSVRLQELSSTKSFNVDLLRRLKWISGLKRKGLLPSGHTTQFVVGGGEESDLEILKTVNWLYRELRLNRAYYSAFTPIRGTRFESKPRTPKVRERRLYQADWLLRDYGFKLGEIVFSEEGNLPLDVDPKLAFALSNPHLYPVDVNEASYEELLRVPGIGPKLARRIINLREVEGKIKDAKALAELGVPLKRTLPFIAILGKKQLQLSSQ